MIDATALFEKAKERAGSWSKKRTLQVLKRIQNNIPGSVIDWEQGDEDWGRVVIGKDVVAIVNAMYPVVISCDSHVEATKEVAREFGLVDASVSSFEDPCLTTDKRELETILSKRLTDVLDYKNISVVDLWWATL